MDGRPASNFARKFGIDSQLIITTAYREYALKGYELHHRLSVETVYVQPVSTAVNKARENISAAQRSHSLISFCEDREQVGEDHGRRDSVHRGHARLPEDPHHHQKSDDVAEFYGV